MKTAEVKSSSTARNQVQAKRQPFFNKEGNGTFFSKSSETATPFFTPTTVQPKLKIGKPNDKYEVEADAMADKVVQRLSNPSSLESSGSASNTAPAVQAKCASCEDKEQLQKKEDELSETDTELQQKPIFESNAEQPEANVQTKPITPFVQAKCATCEQEEKVQKKEEELSKTGEGIQTMTMAGETAIPPDEENIQTKSEGSSTEASVDLESRLNSSKGSGSPLPTAAKSQMESGFGADFSKVRIHTDNRAVQMSQDLGARAFTNGGDIYFNQGQYDTNSRGGQHLLAHELTHTVQQGAATPAIQQKLESTTTHSTIQRGLFGDGLEYLKNQIKSGLNYAAESMIPGYTLLNVILGKNIITDQAVPRTGVNIIKGYMNLLPVVGQLLFNELQETKTLTEAGTWVEQRVAQFGINFDDIAVRLGKMWEEMSIFNGIDGNVAIFRKYFGGLIGTIKRFNTAVSQKVKELRFEGALRLVGAHQLLTALKKSPAALKKAVDNPKLVLSNFMGALKSGFMGFKNNFGTHFKGALLGWLFGKSAEMGVSIPKSFTVSGLFGFIASILGVTYQKIRAQLVKRLGPKGEKIISYMETTAGVIKDFVTRGPIALWERVKESLVNFKEMLFGKITELVMTSVVTSAVTKLVSMLNPAGAIVQLALGIYRVVKFFLEWGARIKELAMGILNSIGTVALGNFKGAIGYIQKLMANGMQIVIAFLAGIFGLGGIVAKVKALIKKIADPIQKAIDKVISWIVTKARGVFDRVFGRGKEKDKNIKSTNDQRTLQEKERDVSAATKEAYKFLKVANATPNIIEEKLPQLKSKYQLEKAELKLNKSNDKHFIEVKINPKKKTDEEELNSNDLIIVDSPDRLAYTKPKIKNDTANWNLYDNKTGAIFTKYVRATAQTGPDMYLKPRESYLDGKIVVLEAKGFRWTDESIRLNLKAYSEVFKGNNAPNLNGQIADSNLDRFLIEYDKIRYEYDGMSRQEIANKAIRLTSFGRSRISKGYSDLRVVLKDEYFTDTSFTYRGVTYNLKDVPDAILNVIAEPNKT